MATPIARIRNRAASVAFVTTVMFGAIFLLPNLGQAQFEAQIAQVCDGSSPNEGTILLVTAVNAPSGSWNLEIFNTNTILASGSNGDLVEVTGVAIGTTIEVVDGANNATIATIINASGATFLTVDDDDDVVEADNVLGCHNELSCAAGGIFDLIAQGHASGYSPGTPGGIIGSNTLAGPHNGNFNAIIFGSFTSDGTGDTEGRLAVQDNFTASGSYTIGGGAPTSTGGLHAPQGWDNLVVGGDVNHSSAFTGPRGNVLYNTATDLPPFSGGFSIIPGMYRNYAPAVSWAAAQTYFQSISSNFSPSTIATNCPAQIAGDITDNGSGNFELDAMNNSGVVVFDLSGYTLTNSPSIDFQNVGNAAAILVLYPGTTVTFSGGAISIDGATPAGPYSGAVKAFIEKTLWNFYEASTFNFSAYAILGSVLAPFTATVNLSGGQMNGQTVFGGTVSQSNGFEFHNFCFSGDLTTCTADCAEIDVSCNGNSIADEDATPGTSDCTDFGCHDVTTGMQEYEFTITNTGTCPLILNGTPLVLIQGFNSGDFMVTEQPTSPVAANGGTTTFKIKFDPTATGLRTATVIIASTDSDENLYNFSIEGYGNDMTAAITVAENSGTPNDGTVCSSANVDLTAVPTGGTGPYTYAWSPNIGADEGPHQVNPVATTTYTVTITDANGCTATAEQTITVSPAPACSITVPVVVCSNSNNNVHSAPGGMSAYAWSVDGDYNSTGPANGQNFSVNAGASGAYTVTVTVTDGNGCTSSCSETVNIDPGPQITLNVNGPSSATCGDDMVMFTVVASTSDLDIAGLQFSVNWDETQLQYISHVADPIGNPFPEDPSVFGITANGEIRYSWANFTGEDLNDLVLLKLTMKVLPGATGSAISVTGTPLALEVADINLCKGTVTPGTVVNITLDPIAVTCPPNLSVCVDEPAFELSDGSPNTMASHSGSGISGSGPYTFTASDAGVGIHNITYTGTDDNGCSNTCEYTITVNALPTPSISGAAPTCVDAMVQLTGTPNAPAGVQTENWSSSDNGIATVDGTGKVMGVSYGTVTITYAVDDNNGCSSSTSVMVTIEQPEMAVSCNSNNIPDGNAGYSESDCTDFGCVNIDGCTKVYTYTIANNGPCPLILDGTPAVLVSGGDEADFTVSQPATTTIAPNSSTTFTITFDPSTTGMKATTVVIANNDSDENPYTFEIQGQGSELLIDLCPADLTDANANALEGCGTDAILAAGHPAYNETEQTVAESVFTNEGGQFTNTCGTTTFKYVDVQTSTCPIIVTRTWTIMDDECGTVRTCDQIIHVDDNTIPNATAPNGSDLECSTDLPPAVTTIADFLNLPGAGAVDNCTAQGNLVVSHLDGSLVGTECSGTIDREYMITDACGNTKTVTQVFTVTDNTDPVLVLNGPNPIELCQGAVYVDPGVTATDNCSGDVTGTVTTAGSIDINTLGDYVVTYTATDDCGNTASITRTFSVNPGFTVDGDVTNVLCHGNSTGAIDLTVTGGLAPLTFDWAGPGVVPANEDQINLPAGTFLVTVTDANGCAVEEEFGITEPTELEITMSGFLPESCAGANDGSAVATASGGVGPYEFKWSNGFIQTHPSASTAMNLAPDNYLLTVTDDNGCSKVEGFVIDGPTAITPSIVSVSPESCDGANDGTATVTATGGIPPYTYAWGAGSTPNAASNSGLADGTYTVTVTDATTVCTATIDVIINAGQALTINELANIGPVCPGATVPTILLSAVPNNPAIVYSWTITPVTGGPNSGLNPDNSTGLNPAIPSFTAGDEGEYDIEVTATLGACSDVVTFKLFIEDANGLHWVNCPANITVNNDVDKCCANVNWAPPTAIDDCVTPNNVTVSGPNGGTSGTCFDVTAPGNPHTIFYTATDGNGNTITCEFTITVRDMQKPTIINCPFGDQILSLDANCEGILGDYTARLDAWDNCGSFTKTQLPAAGGSYVAGDVVPVVITVEDPSGNSQTCAFDVLVEDNTLPVALCKNLGTGTTAFSFTEDFSDNSAGWTLGTEWEIGPTANGCVFQVTDDPALDNTPTADNGVAAVVLGGCASTSPHGFYYLTSPVFDVSGVTGILNLEYYRFLNSDYTPFMKNVVEVYDGTNWVSIWETGSAPGVMDPSWTYQIFDISAHKNANLQVRFGFNIGSAGVYTIGGWNLDDFSLTEVDPAPDPIYLDANGEATISVSDINAGSFDNCGIDDISLSNTEFNCLQVGSNTVVMTVTDVNGNTASCISEIVVADNLPPTALCNNLNLNLNGSGNATISAADVNNGSYDNCAISNTSLDQTFFDCSNLGVNTVTLTVVDIHGNSSTCEATVTISDNEAPTFVNCPTNITFTIGVDADCASGVIWSIPVAEDNCGLASVQETSAGGPYLGQQLAPGTYNIQYTATDGANLTAICNFTVEVVDDQTPILVCQPNLTVNTDDGVCTWTSPSGALDPLFASDNCPGTLSYTISGATVVASTLGMVPAGTVFNSGVSTVEYTYTDGVNPITCSFNVTVVDAEAPTIECPADIVVNNDPNACGAVVIFNDPTVDDNCPVLLGGLSIVEVFNYSGSVVDWVVPAGVTSINIEAKGAQGGDNISLNGLGGTGAIISGDFLVTPGQTIKIVVGQRGKNATTGNQFNGAGGGGGGTFVWLNGALQPLIVAGGGGGSSLTNDGVPHYYGKDASLTNDGTGSRSHDQFGNAPGGTAGSDGTSVSASGGKGWNSVLIDPSGVLAENYGGDGGYGGGGGAGRTPNICNYLHTAGGGGGYSGGGAGGNCYYFGGGGGGSYNIGSAPMAAVGNTGDGMVTITYSASSGGNLVQTTGLSSNSMFPTGMTTNTFVATDDAGNTASCSFKVTVTDEQAPAITCPANETILTSDGGTGDCAGELTWDIPAASDNCGLVNYSVTYQNPDGTIDGPTDAYVFTPGNTANGSPTATRNFEAGGTGLTTVTYYVEDAAGHTNTCTFTVTVTDNENPSFVNCPANITFTIGVDADCASGVIWSIPIAEDNCGTPTVQETSAGGPYLGQQLAPGTYNIQYTATDGANLTAICNFTVEVVDDQTPILVCQPNLTVNTDDGVCTWTSPSGALDPLFASDNCPGTLSYTISGATVVASTPGMVPAGTVFNSGVSTVEYTYTDGVNPITCSFNVTVVDEEAPTIDCPADIVVNNDPGECSAIVVFNEPTVSDNCLISSALSVQFDYTGAEQTWVVPAGVTSIQVEVLGAAGGTGSGTVGGLGGRVTATMAVTPGETLYLNVGGEGYPCLSTSPLPCQNGGFNGGGNTTVPTSDPSDYAGTGGGASDIRQGGNTLADRVIVAGGGGGGGKTFSADANGGNGGGLIGADGEDFIVGMSSDPGGLGGTQVAGGTGVAPATSGTLGQGGSGAGFPGGGGGGGGGWYGGGGGRTGGGGGGSSYTDPLASLVLHAQGVKAGAGQITITYSSPLVQTAGLPSGAAFPVGTTANIFKVTDEADNMATCSFEVTVTDEENPTIDCSGLTTVLTTTDGGTGDCAATYTWAPPTPHDNCGINTYRVTYANPNSTIDGPFDVSEYGQIDDNTVFTTTREFEVGITTVTYYVEDIHGNTTTCAFTVTATDNEPPSFVNCPANITFTIGVDADCASGVIWSIPIAEDNCGTPTVQETSVGGPYLGQQLAPGTYNIQYTATDGANLTAICNFTVEVVDDETPLLVCPPDLTMNTDPGVCTWTSSAGALDALFASDNCPGTLSYTISGATVVASTAGMVAANTAFNLGTSTIEYTYVDGANNSISCSFEVTVVDEEAPVISNCPADPAPICGEGPVFWTAPTADDNCGLSSYTKNYAPGYVFPVGMTIVTYTAVDNSGNTAVCSFKVTVHPVPTPMLTAAPEPVCAIPSFNDVVAGIGSAANGITYALKVPAGAAYTSIDWTITGGTIIAGGDGAMFVEVVWGNGPNGTIAVSVTDANGCSAAMTPVNVTIHPVPAVNSVMLMACPQFPSSNFADFNLVDAEDPAGAQNSSGTDVDGDGAAGTSGGNSVSYHLTEFDAENDLNPLATNAPFNSNSKTIYVRIETASGCVQVRAIWLVVKDTPVSPQTDNASICAGDDSGQAVLSASCPFTSGSTLQTINFDDAPVPCSFDDQVPLTVQYAAQGVIFSGVGGNSWEVLNECGNFSVSGHSSPNFLARNLQHSNTLRLDFSPLASNVSFKAARAGTITATAYDQGGGVLGVQIVPVTNTLQTISLPYSGIDHVHIQSAGSVAVLDDLSFESGDAPCTDITWWDAQYGGTQVGTGADFDPVAASAVNENTPGQYTFWAQCNCPCPSLRTAAIFEVIDVVLNDIANVGPVCPDATVPTILLSATPNNPDIVYSWSVSPGGSGLAAGNSTGLNPNIPGFTAGAEGTYTVTVTAALGACSDEKTFTITINDDGGLHWVNCPADINVNNDVDKCNARVNWTEPTAIDNCSAPSGITVTQTMGSATGSVFSVNGTPHMIAYEATDGNGNTITCAFKVRVRDMQLPDIQCPQDRTVNVDEDCEYTGTAVLDPVASDNCNFSLVNDVNNTNTLVGEVFGLGDHSILWTATDGFPNTSTCSFTLTVVDRTAPTIDCPADIVVNVDQGECGAEVNYTDPVIADNCSVQMIMGSAEFMYTGSMQTFTVPDGVTEIKVEAWGAQGGGDFGGYGGYASALIPVTPNAMLEVHVGGQPTVQLGSGGYNGGGATIALPCGGNPGTDGWPGGGASDVRTSASLSDRIIVAGGGGGMGWSNGLGGAGGGNVGSDGQASWIVNTNGKGGTQLLGGAGGFYTGNGQSAGSGVFGSGGNAGPLNTYCTGGAGGGGWYGGGGGYVSAGGGGSSYISYPGSMMASTTANSRTGNGLVRISYKMAGNLNLVQTSGLPSGNPSLFPVGTTTNTFIAIDEAGNTASCSFNITVIDNEAPVINCPASVSINTDNLSTEGDCAGQYAWSHPIPSDPCGIEHYDVVYTNPDGSIDGPYNAIQIAGGNISTDADRNFTVGTTTVTYYVEDIHGNTNTCAFTVTVTDNEKPTISNCPANPTAICGAGPVWWIPPTADDNCGVVSFTPSHNPGDVFPVGSTVVTYKATDAAGLMATCTFTVTVNPVPTVTATVTNVKCHGESTGSIDITPMGGTPPFTYNWAGPDVSTLLQDQTNLPAGTYHVTVTDVKGCTVEGIYAVTEPTEVEAVVLATQDVSCNGAADGGFLGTAFGGVGPYDFAVFSLINGYIYEEANVPGIEVDNLPAGSYILYVADENGCVALEHFDIHEPTKLIATTINETPESCDGNNDGAGQVSATGGTTPYKYNWGVGVGLTPTAASNSGLADGTYTVTVTDDNDCTATTTVTIGQGTVLEINDLADIGPLCPNFPVDLILLSSVPNNPAIEYSWTGGADAGLPDGTSTGLNPAIPGFTAGPDEGSWEVTVTASYGNCESSKTFTITIEDSGGLHWVNCPADIVASNDIDKCSARVNWTPPTAIDNCTPPNEVGVTQTMGSPTGSMFSVGGSPHLIKYEATDNNGNTITCSFRIRVNDVQEPDAVCKDITVMLNGSGTASISVSDVNNNSSDNCPGMTLGINNSSFDCDDLGANIVILTATDGATMPNTASCMAVVTVVDKIAPTISCPDPLTAVCAAGENPVYTTWAAFMGAGGSGSDNCAINPASFILESEVDNGLSCPRTVTRTYRVADFSGNTAVCTQTITVDDNEAPVLKGASATPKDCGTLAAGDIAFVAFQSDNPDQFAIVTLVPLAAGTVINFTDNGWQSNDNTFTTNEGVIAWTVPGGGLLAGTVVTFNPGALTATSGTVANVDGGFDLSTSGDQVTAFCGSFNTSTGAITGANLAAIDFDGSVGWDTNTTSTNTSALPQGLTNGTTANSTGEADNGKFACVGGTTSGTAVAVATSVNTAANWITSSSPMSPAVAPCTYTITGGGLPPAVVNVSCSEDVPALPEVIAMDNCTNPINVYLNEVLQPGVCDNKFTLTRTWLATDACGNTAVYTQTINVNDNTAPVITGTPNNLTVECDGAGNSNQLIDWLNDHGGFSATDNCGDLTWSNNFGALSNGCGETGSTTVMFTATDACGNTATRTATFTIQDTQAPVWALNPQDLTIECNNTNDPYGQINAWLNTAGGGEANDNCSLVTYSNNFTGLSNGCGTTGSATVAFTATDACGRKSTRTATVQVVDTEGPAITSPAKNQTVECDGNGNTTALNAWLANNGGAVASDDCGSITWEPPVLMNEIEGCGNAKELVYMFQAKDACNNLSANTIASFIIEDTEAPYWVVYPQNASAECGEAPMAMMDWLANFGGGEVEDVCGGASGGVTVMYTNRNDFLAATAGTITTEGFEGKSSASNLNTITFPDFQISTPSNALDIISDNYMSGNRYMGYRGNRKITFSFNSDINTFGIDIKDAFDQSAPNAKMTFMNSAGDAFTIAMGNFPNNNVRFFGIVNSAMVFNSVMIETTSNSNDDFIGMDQIRYGSGPLAAAGSFVYETDLIKYTPSCGNTGVYEYRFTAKDLCGNDTSFVASFTVVDNTPPSLNPPANLTLSCVQDQQDNSAAIIDWLDNYTASDECGTVDVTHNFSATTINYCTGDDIIVMWTAVDECGNVTTKTALIEITKDETPPSITPPANLTLSCVQDQQSNDAAIVDWLDNYIVSDGCDSEPTVTHNFSGTTINYCTGDDILVTWTATDDCGNASTTSALIVITKDETPPSITPPANLTLSCVQDQQSNNAAIIDWLDNYTVSDGCDSEPTVTHNFSGTTINYCTGDDILVTWTAMDDCGNASTTSALIVITKDETPPAITAPANITLDCGDISGTTSPSATIADWLDNYTVSDICDSEPTVTHNFNNTDLDVCTGGVLTVTWTAVDDCGNANTTAATITVVPDTEKPMFTHVPDDLTLDCSNIGGTNDASAVIAQWLDSVTASDNCDDDPTVTYSGAAQLDYCTASTTTVTWTAEDACGNNTSVSRTITVIPDTEKPMFTNIPDDLTLDCSNIGGTHDASAVIAQWLDAVTASDNCDDDPTVTYTGAAQLDYCTASVTTVTWTAEDACGNSTSVSRTITVVPDTEKPMLSVPDPIVLDCGDLSETADPSAQILDWLGQASATDNCDDDPTVSYDFDISDLNICASETYTITVTWTATDACNNTTSTISTITVVP
ncbi:MAG: HYR domain-containing protein, partial [Lewinellaceae bacterium]|nr:HYR domain-containing protein [Lewinellaceae bacterium]